MEFVVAVALSVLFRMALFFRIVAFLCTLCLLVLVRSWALLFLEDAAAPPAASCDSLSAAELLEVNAPRDSALFPFRRDVQEQLLTEIKDLIGNLTALETEAVLSGRRALVVDATADVQNRKFHVAWRLAQKTEPSLDLVVVRDGRATQVAEEFAKLSGCETGGLWKTSDAGGRCVISEASDIPWTSYSGGVLLTAPTESMPEAFSGRTTRATKAFSTSAHAHLQWLLRKFGIPGDGVALVEIGNLFVAGERGREAFELRRLLVRWLEDYEFGKFEKFPDNDEAYWPWVRRVQLAQTLLGKILKVNVTQ